MYSGRGNTGRGKFFLPFLFVVVALLLAVSVPVGCGQGTGTSADAAKQGKSTAAATIQIRGSDSEVNLVQRLAELFMEDHPGVQIAVTGGGSGTGIAALIDGTIDIANSSRPMKEEEINQARRNGIEPVPVRFAVDGVAVIVNESNPVETLSVAEIGAIFRGDITNWREVGGEDSPIGIYGRQSNSGTYVFFMETVLQGDYTPQMRNMGGNADIVEAVTTDKTGIGYVAIGYVTDGGSVRPGIKPVKVSRNPGETSYTPIELENITSGKYPITRPLYQFLNGRPEGAVKDFIMFELSDRGQKIVLEQGFYPITDEDRKFNENSLK
ncbi:MAG: phosphate ABC transporter substrate-binding protein [Bacillota bacterium]